MSGPYSALIVESLLMTALLIGVVLVLRRPVAALFGPRLAYALWLTPAVRLILPPLPGETVVVEAPSQAGLAAMPLVVNAPGITTSAASAWSDLVMPAVLPLWIGGAAVVLAIALARHMAWVRALRRDGTMLDPAEGVPVVMSDRVDGPVAIGLWQPLIAVPADFFARYNRAERELAIAHELAHHRAGDLWANAAALTVLAAQWFNPLAWRAVAAFRFDQEAACDARVLAGLAPNCADHQAHSYACAIAKTVAGPRLLLAAPMTSGTKVKERLLMLTHNPRLGLRPAMGRLLLCSAIGAAMALTVSSLPAQHVWAAEPASPDAAVVPPPRDMAKAGERQVVVFHTTVSDDGTADMVKVSDETEGRVQQIILSPANEASEKPRVLVFGDGSGAETDGKKLATLRMALPSFGPSNDDLRATLKEQGIDDAKAEAIIKSVDKKRAEARAHSRLAMVPLIAGEHGYPITEGTYRKLRQLAVPSVNEREMLGRTLNAMTAARENYARKVGERNASNPAILESLDREIEHLKDKIKRM